uniref:Natural killer cell receptor Ly-49P3 n=1 Tax=Mus musculus TaxID=10090 RepID=Q9EP94_MOUSE|nr:natural killer cell receptor Ly49P3 isoform [Mus musculus]AAF99595.1 natural killer cell receptor Ly-49P3 [Mus musculus]|eukprot:XP_017174444.1 PREDICTED: T-cell surface glycoprotein YE1/48-like isoform X4 [Mus musculus]
MSEQEVTFSTVRFQKTSGLQNRVRLEETLKPRKAGLRGRGDKVYWFCYGRKCYYFVMDRKPWSGCKQTCQSSGLSLLKIDDEDELKFLQLVVPSDVCWIGLSYDNKKKDWSWVDNGPSKLALNTRKYNIRDGGCMLLSKTRLDNGNCDQVFICICAKRLDKFPH